MTDASNTNARGNKEGSFSQGVGGFAEYTVSMTEVKDKVRHEVKVPPKKVIPIIFLPGVMGSNLRMSAQRQQRELGRPDNRAWRPDDLMNSKVSVALNRGFGGWYRKASPAQRQMIFDPNQTEVDYYRYTEDKGKFDPDGRLTRESDARHQNIPDNYSPVPPLIVDKMAQDGKRVKVTTTAAQIARWRGWSEILVDGAYEQVLRTAEKAMNNMITQYDSIHPLGPWQPRSSYLYGDLLIPKEELRKISNCWYPVHAMGYNFLKSNADSAKSIAERIRGVVSGYQKRGFDCNEVIIVTHSMGGLVARALIHPNFGNLLNDSNVKVLGIYHSAMPTLGAAASYRRMRFGFQEKDGMQAEIFAELIGIDGEHATAILANTPAPLELLPGTGYGKEWLRVVDRMGRTVRSWPNENETALDNIYLQPAGAWWRLVNPDWVNPARFTSAAGGGITEVQKRLVRAVEFQDKIQKTFHPTQTYASFCVDKERLSYGNLVFKIMNPEIRDASLADLPPADTWTLLTDDRRGTMTVQAGKRVLTLALQPATEPGDETVPAERSARHITGKLFPHGNRSDESYEHQGSYANSKVLGSMLYSLAKIAATAKWD
ncbi:esterase/lipase family protein [Pseudoduganella chitinolytica]|uniref:GPI inositol-deacylase PGAP1-like alpha/beta domain-containing protein n=1 Tax=Pseudoduganella chitinolytica TaxID=34070 RepID=A0ABY8BBE4_9BURK|nr:hypothetical protein [Pseudoduganella chitinolytica]WEF32092.1 hypothetical protein PX653_22120 [Pseudoduganella chitinolytica]